VALSFVNIIVAQIWLIATIFGLLKDKKVLEGDVSIIGKKKMGFDVYKKICGLFLKEEGEEFIFARAFLCLEWNLMARS
jgi:hypothetical protein